MAAASFFSSRTSSWGSRSTCPANAFQSNARRSGAAPSPSLSASFSKGLCPAARAWCSTTVQRTAAASEITSDMPRSPTSSVLISSSTSSVQRPTTSNPYASAPRRSISATLPPCPTMGLCRPRTRSDETGRKRAQGRALILRHDPPPQKTTEM